MTLSQLAAQLARPVTVTATASGLTASNNLPPSYSQAIANQFNSALQTNSFKGPVSVQVMKMNYICVLLLKVLRTVMNIMMGL